MRKNVVFGGGEHTALIHIPTNDNPHLWVYGGGTEHTAALHARLGGKTYYESRSGRSGAGYVTAPNVFEIGTYRTDTVFPHIVKKQDQILSDITGHWQIHAPIACGFGLSHGPLVATRDGEFMIEDSVWELFSQIARPQGLRLQDVKIVEISRQINTAGEVKSVVSRVYSGKNERECRWAIESFIEGLEFQLTQEEQNSIDESLDRRFWARLGFIRVGAVAYKLTRGICRGQYALDQWQEVQEHSPDNVIWIDECAYIQDDDLVVLTKDNDGVFCDFERALDPIEKRTLVLDIRGRGTQEILRSALEAGKKKLSQITFLVERCRVFCDEFANLEVTIADSEASGNCGPGSEAFKAKHFPGKDRIYVKDLIPFLEQKEVRNVISYLERREKEE